LFAGKIEREKPRVDTHGIHGQSRAEPPALFDSDNESLSSLSSDEVPIHTEKQEIVPTLARDCSSSSDDESVGGKPQDDQQRRRREQDQKTARNREEKGDHGFNNENRSPNTSSAAPTDRDPQSLPAQSGTTPAWSSQTTSAPTSLRQVWDASSQFDTAQGHGRGSHMNMPPVGTYSSDQSPQRPGYIQQKSKKSARDRGHGAQHTSQAQAKDRSGTIPVGKLNARGYFGTPQGHGRGIQMNMPPTGGAYSSDQSPHDPSYTQQTTKRS
jgi:hypothetical protein